MVEKRENEIDTLKGIGILFVIASHCDANLRLFFSYPFSFTIPLFFWVAGYFLTNRTSFPVFVGKKFNRLMLSYWLWCVLSADVFFIQTRLHNPLAYFPIPAELWRMFLLSSSLLWMPPILNVPLWFFPALFAVLLLLYPCVGWSGKKLGWSMAALFVLTPVWQSFISREWIFSCRVFPPALFFGLGGIYAARNKTFLKNVLSVPMTLILLASGFGLAFGHWADIFDASSPLFFMAAVSSILGWYGAAMRLDCRLLQFAGRHSLILLGCHVPVLQVVKVLLFGYTNKGADTSDLTDNIAEFICVSVIAFAIAGGYAAITRKLPRAKYGIAAVAVAVFGYYVYKSP